MPAVRSSGSLQGQLADVDGLELVDAAAGELRSAEWLAGYRAGYLAAALEVARILSGRGADTRRRLRRWWWRLARERV